MEKERHNKIQNIENIIKYTNIMKDNGYMKTLEKLSWFTQIYNDNNHIKFKDNDIANVIAICNVIKNIMQYLDKE